MHCEIKRATKIDKKNNAIVAQQLYADTMKEMEQHIRRRPWRRTKQHIVFQRRDGEQMFMKIF